MNQAPDRIHVVKFRYLAEFRTWLEEHNNKEILDIATHGGWEDMMILVTYKIKGD